MTIEEAIYELETNVCYATNDIRRACIMAVEALEQQKTGKWIDCSDEGYVECPFCGHATTCEDNIDELHYCFYCGARMEAENGTI